MHLHLSGRAVRSHGITQSTACCTFVRYVGIKHRVFLLLLASRPSCDTYTSRYITTYHSSSSISSSRRYTPIVFSSFLLCSTSTPTSSTRCMLRRQHHHGESTLIVVSIIDASSPKLGTISKAETKARDRHDRLLVYWGHRRQVLEPRRAHQHLPLAW